VRDDLARRGVGFPLACPLGEGLSDVMKERGLRSS
jgi:hypothetical protein